jgi:hypothetical protein
MEMATKTTHTPGPYKATHIGEGEFRKEVIIDVPTYGLIAEVLDTGNGKANATLLAASPDLLDACTAAALSSATHPGEDARIPYAAWKQLHSAIAKATGQS